MNRIRELYSDVCDRTWLVENFPRALAYRHSKFKSTVPERAVPGTTILNARQGAERTHDDNTLMENAYNVD